MPAEDIDTEVAEDTDIPVDDEGVEGEMAEEALSGAEESVVEDEVAEELPPAPAPAGGASSAPFPVDQFADALKNALAPMIPKPPAEKKWWDDPKTMHENMLRNPEKFHKGLHEILDHKMSAEREQTHGMIKQLFQIVQHIQARSAERPDFGKAQGEAAQLAKAYGIDHNTALRMVLDRAKTKSSGSAGTPAQSGKKVRVPPGHASAPDTRQSTTRVTSDKGPADFKSIVGSLMKGAAQRGGK